MFFASRLDALAFKPSKSHRKLTNRLVSRPFGNNLMNDVNQMEPIRVERSRWWRDKFNVSCFLLPYGKAWWIRIYLASSNRREKNRLLISLSPFTLQKSHAIPRNTLLTGLKCGRACSLCFNSGPLPDSELRRLSSSLLHLLRRNTSFLTITNVTSTTILRVHLMNSRNSL